MQFEIGQVVRSTAGHDADNYMLVVGFDSQRVLLCDGKQRPLEKPKCKNPRHLAATKLKLSADAVETNRSLARALAALRRDEGD